MLDLLKSNDLISLKHLNELIKGLNKREEAEERKVNTWLIVGLVTLGLLVAGLIVFKVFFASDDEFDEFDEFEDDFDDMDYDDDYDDFDDFDEDEDLDDEDIEDDFEDDEDDDTEQ